MADAGDSARIETVIVEGETSSDVTITGEAPLGRRLFAEFFGTTVFVAVGTGAATVLALGPGRLLTRLEPIFRGLRESGQVPPEQVEQQIGEQLLLFGTFVGNSFGDLLPVAFAFATALAVLTYALGGVSGAHFNPAVSFGLAVVRRFPWREVPFYWVAQCLGAITGAFVISGIYGKDGASFEGTRILFGATTVARDIQFPQAVLAEAFIAFILVTAIMAIAIDPRAPKGWSGLIIGLGLGAGILVTATATGGSANFARSLGPFVSSWIGGEFLDYGSLNIPWSDLAVYAIGPIIGASAAALVYESVTGLEVVTPAPKPGAASGEEDDLAEPPA